MENWVFVLGGGGEGGQWAPLCPPTVPRGRPVQRQQDAAQCCGAGGGGGGGEGGGGDRPARHRLGPSATLACVAETNEIFRKVCQLCLGVEIGGGMFLPCQKNSPR